MSSEKGVQLPSKELIQKWNSLSDNIISESAACAVPNTVFIQYENEKFYKRNLFEKEIPFLTASSNVSRIKVFDDLINNADNFINRIYSRRSISNALSTYVQAKKGTVINEAQPYFQEIFSLCSDAINFLNDCSSIIHNLFDTATIWQSGHYSDVLLDQVCTLYYKLATLDEMKLFKSSLANDLTFFKSLTKGAQSTDTSIQELQMKINTAQLFDTLLLKAENERSKADRQKISAAFITFIQQNLEKDNFLAPESLYVYIRFLIFLCKYTEQDQKVLQLLVQQASKHPLLPLAYEVSIKTADYCKSIKGFDKEFSKFTFDPKGITAKMNELKGNLEVLISELPSKITNATQKVIPPDQFLDFIMNLIHLVASLKNTIREQYAYKLSNIQPPGKSEEEQSMYERSIRKGYSSEELSTLIRSLMLWRSTCDKLRDSSEAIMRIISESISTSFQFFVKNTCEKVIRKSKKEYEQKLQDIIMPLSNMCGDWNGQPVFQNMKKKKQPPYPHIPRIASPSLEAIEFVRIQLQHIINPTSEFMKNGARKTWRKEELIPKVQDYIANSFLHTTILQFNQLISNIADQSDLYFKEVQLDLNKTINFPIKSSLPYILCEYALQNFKIPELTELIFFPLGIYDDAANVASTKLNSLFLLDEIRAESQMCLEALTSMISNFVFSSFRTFASVKLLPENIKSSLHLEGENDKKSDDSLHSKSPGKHHHKRNSTIKHKHHSSLSNHHEEAAHTTKKREWAQSRAYRLTSLLQQNQFYLLWKLIDVKSMIAKPIEKLIMENLENLMQTSTINIGTGALVAIYHGIQIMRETHRLIYQQGIELSHFEILLKVAFRNTVPNSYLSVFISNIISNLTEKVAKHCFLMTNPLRLVYPKVKGLPNYTFGKQTLGKALKNAFDSTVSPITVDHFCCFTHLLENGEIAVFIPAFSEELRNKVNDFINVYEELQTKISRCQDLSLSSSAQQVLDHFVGNYGIYEDEQSVKNIFNEMKAIGNMLATAYMLDIAIMNSKITREELIAFFKGYGKDGKNYNNVDELFPKILADEFKTDDSYLFTYGLDTYPVTLTHCLAAIINAIKSFGKVDLFDESSDTILNFRSLTGFASKWTVLEFIYIYSDAVRNEKDPSNFHLYGEGVMLFAAVLILTMRQERIYHMVNIGRKIQRVSEIDFGTSKDGILSKYTDLNKLETATMDWAFQLFQPIIRHINSSDIFE